MKALLKFLIKTALILGFPFYVPILYVEFACRGEPLADDYASLLPPEHHRPEARTLMTYPEWHIVHAYTDYARVIEDEDPHDFSFLGAIWGFWSSLCTLNEASAAHGGVDGETKQMVYVIGASFTAEMLLKAAYEETFGHIAALIRGPEREPLDDLSARQAAEYAAFLRQTPWYKYDFLEDDRELDLAATDTPRDNEREIALGIENRVKARYAAFIADRVAEIGPDEQSLRMVAWGLSPSQFGAYDGVSVIGPREPGVELEVPRYAKLTKLLEQMALDGAEFVEIAGNDDILITVLSDRVKQAPGSLMSVGVQGTDDRRFLMLVKVPELAETLRGMQEGLLRLEHIHDY
ncbi:hypothetical protein [Litorisediminicola beolgyonensis]|uniref:Uncharacterized protein n=1 Tax=Litorisediminicola beolgyonensis TaxID=1173614 RepID=A0ABW3ZM87_9RHOB